MTPQICYFLVPSIGNRIPLEPFMNAVRDTRECHSIWLLYSVVIAIMSVLESKLGMVKFFLNSSFGKTRKYLENFCFPVLVKTQILELTTFKFFRVVF